VSVTPGMASLRLAFMGSADFSVPTLRALLEAGHRVVSVYTQPPRPAGRGHRERLSPVHAFAAEHGLEVRTPASLKGADEQEAFEALSVDAAVVAAYGLILPAPVLGAPRLGCLNVHASLLPRWRGAAPIQRAILAGDLETGVTIMQMDEGLDTGPILSVGRVPVAANTTAASLHDVLAEMGARLMVQALEGVAAETLTARPQPETGATYARKLERGEGRLDWRKPAVELERAVRALNPWPGVWFEYRSERIRVLAAEAVEAVAAPGTVVDGRLTIACSEGGLRPLRVQRAGKAPVNTDAFLRGFALPEGTLLS
jgi:methionyl-tRNA formyltransferase